MLPKLLPFTNEELLEGCNSRLASIDKDINAMSLLASRYGIIQTPEYLAVLDLLKLQKIKYHKNKNRLEKLNES